jgi:transcriptional regulator GlxA family with amidase domain
LARTAPGLALEFCEAIVGAAAGGYKRQYVGDAASGAMLTQDLLNRMCRARAALLDLDADVTVASLARTSRLSRSQFILRYRAAFGDTPHQTRVRARIERARWLLATTGLTVTEVCMAVGFSSLGSFSRLFRIRCGESPLHFRKRLQCFDEPARRSQLAPHCLPLMTAAWTEPPDFSRSGQLAR